MIFIVMQKNLLLKVKDKISKYIREVSTSPWEEYTFYHLYFRQIFVSKLKLSITGPETSSGFNLKTKNNTKT